MSLSRSRRLTKSVNYSTIENDTSDDDDFCDFTPPTKKIKESKKKKETKEDVNYDTTIPSVITSSTDKSPKKRLSLEERKFQRDMELALNLSTTNEKDFQGFSSKENETKPEDLEFFSPLRNSVVTVEVHALPSEMDVADESNTDLPEKQSTQAQEESSDALAQQITQIENTNLEIKIIEKENTNQFEKSSQDADPYLLKEKDFNDIKEVSQIEDTNLENKIIERENTNQFERSLQDTDSYLLKEKDLNDLKVISACKKKESIPSTSKGSTAKRQRKKVNFVEDDSDSWSENEIKTATKSETDESDYFPSPTKIKKKKENKKVEKNHKRKEPPTSKSARIRKPLKDRQNTSEDSLAIDSVKTVISEPEITKAKSSKSCSAISKSQFEVIDNNSLPSINTVSYNTNPKSNTSCDVIPKSNKSCDVKPQQDIIKFKSPMTNSVSSPKVPARIGLRLGLSRRGIAKPLHPNASVK